ncbi:MAG: hypothetical protein LQ346_004972 [Caloplaca aetnensis]|nr:MAG: hypothetical protein LQ346_004972 [Caloplaca aetnensis]
MGAYDTDGEEEGLTGYFSPSSPIAPFRERCQDCRNWFGSEEKYEKHRCFVKNCYSKYAYDDFTDREIMDHIWEEHTDVK